MINNREIILSEKDYDLYAYFNGNISTTNKYIQYIDSYSTTNAAGRINAPIIGYTNPSVNTSIKSDIKLTNNGYIAFQHNSTYYVGSGSIDEYNELEAQL